MKEYIIIKEFGPIKDIEFELKKINVFIGEQGVGKSTVAKLYSCMQDIALHYLIAFNSSRDIIMLLFKQYEIHTYFNDDTFIEYHSSAGLTLKYEAGAFSISHSSLTVEAIKTDVQQRLADCIEHSFQGRGIPMTGDFKDLSDEEKEQLVTNMLRTSLYLPAERSLVGCTSSSLMNLILAKVPLPKMLLQYLSFFEKAKNECQEYEVPFLGLTFRSSKKEDKVLIDGKEVELRYCSSGIQSIVPMLMIVDYCLKQNYFSCYALEEPEISLFPTNQLELLRYFTLKANQENGIGKMIVTTHSPYVLSILNVSVMAGKIAAMSPEAAEEVSALLPKEYHLDASDISVLSLGKQLNGGSECISILDSSTGLIKGNYLDAVSSIISADFNRLNKLYIKVLRAQ